VTRNRFGDAFRQRFYEGQALPSGYGREKMRRRRAGALLLYIALAAVILLAALSIAIFLGEPGLQLKSASHFSPW